MQVHRSLRVRAAVHTGWATGCRAAFRHMSTGRHTPPLSETSRTQVQSIRRLFGPRSSWCYHQEMWSINFPQQQDSQPHPASLGHPQPLTPPRFFRPPHHLPFTLPPGSPVMRSLVQTCRASPAQSSIPQDATLPVGSLGYSPSLFLERFKVQDPVLGTEGPCDCL